MLKKAIIDIGSNSTLLLIAELNEDNDIVEFENESEVTALGKNLDKTGVFCEESMNLLRSVLKKYKSLIDKYGVSNENIWVSATEASRVAKNAQKFYQEIQSNLGLKVNIISGEGEAYYTAFGVAKGFKNKSDMAQGTVIMDVGGASTEFIKVSNVDGFSIKNSISLPFGSVRGTDWLKAHGEEFFFEKIEECLSDDLSIYSSKEIVAVAGTMTSLGAMLKKSETFDANTVHNSECTLKDLERLKKTISTLSSDEILSEYPFLGKRAETIYGGLKVIIIIGRFLNVEKFIISTYGLRYGVFLAGGINEQYIQ